MMFTRDDLEPYWVADMFVKTPDFVVKKMHDRLDHSMFGYTLWKHDDFYQPIRYWFKERFNTTLFKENLLYVPTVLFAITEIVRMMSKEGDSVILHTPSYNAFLTLLKGNNRKIIESPLVLNEQGTYEFDIDVFEQRIIQNDVKVFILCNPQNPTGKAFSRETLEQLKAICHKHNVYIISDEVHMDFVRTENGHETMAKDLIHEDRIAVVTGLGKTFNLASITHGVLISKDKWLLKKLESNIHKVYGLSPANSLALSAIEAAYTKEGIEWVNALNDHLESNMKYIKQYIEDHLSHELSMEIPEATYLAWISFEKSGYHEKEVQDALQNVGRIALSPGHHYELSESVHFRLNAASPHERIEEAMTRIHKAFKYLRNKKNPS